MPPPPPSGNSAVCIRVCGQLAVANKKQCRLVLLVSSVVLEGRRVAHGHTIRRPTKCSGSTSGVLARCHGNAFFIRELGFEFNLFADPVMHGTSGHAPGEGTTVCA